MPGDVLRLGPFVGGLNLASDISSVADEELVKCLNLELDIDGSLKNRPPFVRHVSTAPEGHRIIGNAVFSGTGYLFSSGQDSGGNQNRYYSTDGTTWTKVGTTDDKLATTMVQFKGKVWFPSHPTSVNANGTSWDPIGGATSIPAMPQGSHAVVHKERMYLVPGQTATTNESRLYFSAPGDLTSWPGANFIDVSPGDGESLNAVIVYNDNLLLFKDNSVYVLAYDLNPSDAILREINPVLGCIDGDNVIQFENVVYAIHDDTVYEIVNYDFNPINVKAPFVLNTSVPPGQSRLMGTGLSIVGERLLVKFYAKLYVFGLRTRTWSEWAVTYDPVEQWHEVSRFWRLPGTDNYFTRRAYNQCTCVMKMPENPTTGDKELLGFAGLKLDGITGDYVSTPNVAPLQIVNDIDIRAKISMDDWTPAATTWIVSKAISTGSSRAYGFMINTSGTLAFQWYEDGINLINKPSTVATGFADGTVHWIRVTLDVDNGAAGNDVKFWTSTDGIVWTQLGTTVTTAGITSIFAGTNDLEIGARNQGTTDKMTGKVYQVQVRNGIDGTLVANPNFAALTILVTTFIDSVGRTWTVHGEAIAGAELITCTAKTKDFDYADPVHYKRLFWWSADLLNGSVIVGRTSIVTYSYSPSWDDLGSLTWDQLGPWDSLTLIPQPIITTQVADNNFILAKTVKFLKGIRFRKINFEVEMNTDGTSLQPAKLFSMTTTVLTKQGIGQKVS